MWLPTPVYRSLPIAYALAGAAFILGTFYLGISEPMGPIYLGLGIVSLIASVTVAYWRYKFADQRQKVDTDEPPMA